jgi:hypothetical protein
VLRRAIEACGCGGNASPCSVCIILGILILVQLSSSLQQRGCSSVVLALPAILVSFWHFILRRVCPNC